MKAFNEMTSAEIQTMSSEEFKAVSPFEKHSCVDCAFLKAVVSLWCTNERAIKARGTRLPGIIKCPFWEPNWKYIDKKYRTSENGYVPVIKKVKNLLSRIFSCQKK